ncbi:hypothetical protein N866_05805 [Actinotalea ferrariae CF5-4]|uniref:Cell division protein FtsL n=1 Tax=Actinotalea ferrariae CF5-4 TaxID=948458 RepID=A0A021VNL5_9CELL|nr:hypothetical protein [Actinotalea ferrariae]EYR62698.1 hypothetical protein N866_05805 [Actinotalea ferrariae CF5-4]
MSAAAPAVVPTVPSRRPATSTATAPATAPRPAPERRPAPAPARPRLHVVRAPEHARTRTPFVVLCMGVLAASLLGTLLLNTAMAQGEYDRFALQTELTRAAQEEQQLAGEMARLESPAQIAGAAASLGMVPSSGGGYLRLSDGAVLGNPTPAGADQ